jgi:gliding motility-associated-like protein
MATHLMGGEITWRCLGNGRFIFQLKVYRDCETAVPVVQPGGTISLRVHNHPTVTAIPLTQVSFLDISPQCNGIGPSYNCNTPSPGNTAAEEYIFESNPVFLNGTPPPQGWVFTYDDCCRNAAIDNLSLTFSGPGNPTNGMTLRAIMYAYNGQNTNPCYDSSPVFQERPAIIICAGTPFTYNHNAYDPDLDSLSYSFADALNHFSGAFTSNNPTPIPFETGYSLNSPLPSTNQNPNNLGLTLNPITGEMNFTSFTLGNYVSVIKVQAFKCGQLVAEIFREIQIIIISCGANFPPGITPPFIDPTTGLQTSFVDTVNAGDLVQFQITATDGGLLPNNQWQSVIYTAGGGQFGAGFTDPNSGCPNLPCATLTPPPPSSAFITNGTTFNWQTSCEHISSNNECYSASNTHVFTFIFKDDYCPAPSYSVATVTIVVNAVPVIPAPDLRCLAVQNNGDVLLTWIPPPDPEGTFNSYHVYSSTNINGPYAVIDSIFNYNQTTYLHTGAGANAGTRYYFLRSRSGCFGKVFTSPSDTLQTIFVSIGALNGTQYPVNWNHLSTPPPPTAANQFAVLKNLNNAGLNPYTQTAALTISEQTTDCSINVAYQVQLPDQSGCVSSSNIAQTTLNFNQAPVAPQLDSVSVGFNSLANVGWLGQAGNLYSYIIANIDGGAVTYLDTLSGLQNYIFINPQSQAAGGPESYALALQDTCNNLSSFSVTHTTMYLDAKINGCTNKVELFWTPYFGFPIDRYNVFYSLNGGPNTYLATVNGNTNTYIHSNLQAGGQYCYFIRAYSTTGNASSSSNVICFTANVLQPVDFVYMNYATVVSDYQIELKAYYDNNADVNKYLFSRFDLGTGLRDTLGPFNLNLLTPFIEHLDVGVFTQLNPYRYELILKDSCGNIAGVSNHGQTIHLKAKATPGFYNHLNWTPYSLWLDGGVERYNIYRCRDPLCLDRIWINTVDNNVYFYEEDVMDSLTTTAEMCYMIEAVEAAGNRYGFKERSYSNIVCVTQYPVMFVPNAWVRKGGISPVFIPRGKFAEMAKVYKFRIYNRWGEMIFETFDPYKGWDGTYMGSPVPMGAYVYDIILETFSGKDIRKLGSVTVLE